MKNKRNIPLKQKILFILIVFIFITFDLFAKEKVLFADLDGNGKKEQIIISYAAKSGAEVNGPIQSLKIFDKKRLVYSYDKFDKSTPYINSKVFGTKKNLGVGYRDIIFIVVGDCEVLAHFLSCKVFALDEHGKKNKVSYILQKDILQIETGECKKDCVNSHIKYY